ncbi:hypothetical protein ACOSQ3_028450 [Xanthoceras sorbifolium]
MYHIDNYKVDNGDDSADSDSDIGVTANVDSREKNEDNDDDESDEEQLSNAASFNWDDDFILHDSDNDDTAGQTSKVAERAKGKPCRCTEVQEEAITGGTKRRNFDIGNTSTLAARRKLNLDDTATFGRVNVGQPHIQQTSTQFQDLPLELKL